LTPLRVTRHGLIDVLDDIIAEIIQWLVIVGIRFSDIAHGNLVSLKLLAIDEVAIIGKVGANVSETVGQSVLAFVSLGHCLARRWTWRRS